MNKRILILVGLLLVLTLVTTIGSIPVSAADGGGTVVAWGRNDYGQANVPPGLTDVVAIAAGYRHNLALRADGTVVAWGRNYAGETNVPVGLTDVVAITGGGFHTLALKAGGAVVGWGWNNYGQASPPAGLTNVAAISAGEYHSLALKADGTVVGWGRDHYGQASPPAAITGVVAISAGGDHSLALKADGTVVGWGRNGNGQASPPTALTGVVAIAAGLYHSLALKADGTVVGWGWNQYGPASPPAGLTDVVAIDAGYAHSLALKADGTVVGWGLNNWGQTNIPAGLTDVVAISAGWGHNLALVAPNEPPVSDPNGPYLGAMGAEIGFDGTASSDPDGDPLGYNWYWGDTTASPDAGTTPTHAYGAAGIYDVCLTVADPDGASDTACTYAVVYDPDGGFVTGGGWIYSEPGAYVPDPLLEGKATFGFVSKYKKGADTPTGNTEFQFHAGGLNFHSTSYDWLVVTGSNYAKFKGVGAINGEGEYKFMLRAGDNDPDTFRIKIWYEDGNEVVVYDNGFEGSGYETGQPLGGGSIVIHTKK